MNVSSILIYFLLFFLISEFPQSASFEPYDEIISGSDEIIPMAPIKGGSFMAGSSKSEKDRNEDEGPLHEVYVDDFWMGTYEITWDQYQLFLYRETDNIPLPEKGDLRLEIDGVSGATMPYVNLNKAGHPVVNITQYAASTFCKWLSAKTGRFYRLPTEAEWEYACRAGSSSAYSFPNSSNIDQYAWYNMNSNRSLQKPGQKKPNGWGLYDMHGNAAEWVLDSYFDDSYKKLGNSKNPVILGEGLYPRVVRGGSWKDPVKKLRSASRGYSTSTWKQRDPQFPKSLWWHTDALHIGFRIVRPKIVPSMVEMEKYWVKPIPEY